MPGIIAFILGVIAACITGGTFATYLPGVVEKLPFLNVPFFVGPINGIIVSLIAYTVLGMGVETKKTQEAAVKRS